MIKAPYDERNKSDYLAISSNIEIALNLISTNMNIPATQVSLAKLVGCSRGTLRNRIYPLERLRAIKKLRAEKQKASKKSPRITSAHRIAVETHIDEKNSLREQLDKSRFEIAVWVNKYSELEREVKKLHRLSSVLVKGKEFLDQRVRELESNLNGDQSAGKKSLVILKGQS